MVPEGPRKSKEGQRSPRRGQERAAKRRPKRGQRLSVESAAGRGNGTSGRSAKCERGKSQYASPGATGVGGELCERQTTAN